MVVLDILQPCYGLICYAHIFLLGSRISGNGGDNFTRPNNILRFFLFPTASSVVRFLCLSNCMLVINIKRSGRKKERLGRYIASRIGIIHSIVQQYGETFSSALIMKLETDDSTEFCF